MTRLRVGTRGSDLALWQTNWVCDRLREIWQDLEIEHVIIATHGDVAADESFGRDWPVGAFVSAIERAVLDERVDFAVHSYKDLQTAETAGLVIAATPPREVVHDVLVTRGAKSLEELPSGARIGTGSPRRAAQLLRLGAFEIVPTRGNVPTRIAKIERENLDAVALAAAGLARLQIEHPHVVDLPTDQVIPAPAQGALAVQARTDSEAARLIASLDDSQTRRCVLAERMILRRISAGCHTPVGALARATGEIVTLRARLFTDDFARFAEGSETGSDPAAVGVALADRLLEGLQ